MYKFKKTHEKLNKPKVCNAKIQLVIRVKPTNNLSTFKCNNVHDKYHFKRTKLCIDFSKFNTRENKVFHTQTQIKIESVTFEKHKQRKETLPSDKAETK